MHTLEKPVHSRAPFTLNEDGEIISADEVVVGNVLSVHDFPCLDEDDDTYAAAREEYEANARLFLAAPDLLAEARRFVLRCEAGEILSRKTYAAFKALVNRCDGVA